MVSVFVPKSDPFAETANSQRKLVLKHKYQEVKDSKISLGLLAFKNDHINRFFARFYSACCSGLPEEADNICRYIVQAYRLLRIGKFEG